MASTPAPVTAETPITLKISHLGLTKKVKLPLRDLVASSLEDKLRETLAIDPTTTCRFERYSDSAGRFVILDRNNQAVYKQLYRAAKAKQKLKLRVIMAEPQLAQHTAPRPVTIEDVPEGSVEPLNNAVIASTTPVAVSASIAQAEEDRQQCPAIPGRFPSATSLVDGKPSSWANDVDAHLTATLQNMARNHELLERHIARLGASVAEMGLIADNTSVPKTSASTAPSDHVPEITAAALEAMPAAIDALASPAPPQPIPVVKCTPRNPQAVWSFLDCAAGYDMKPAPTPSLQAGFSVCCNSCERTIADTHFHCSTCEEGDFDLCENCVDLGTTCYNSEHWMIKRCIKDGAIVNSTTERVPTKPKSPKRSTEKLVDTTPAKEVKSKTFTPKQTSTQQATACAVSVAGQSKSVASVAAQMSTLSELFTEHVPAQQMRTCNNCIQELPEAMFLHCTTCFDFDLCKECFVKNEHGHHPKHAFTPAVAGTHFENSVRRRLAPGRGQRHNAVCDGCDTFITGVRHKCMGCPDWDYCADCVVNASLIHHGHRFVPIYEPLSDVAIGPSSSRQVHVGIYCDGPLCSGVSRCARAIVGERYKCAVCSDVDFCACCEASPANTHNKTHPLIKFKTPVRHVSVTTTGEDAQGQEMRAMGDKCPMAWTFEPPRWTPSSSNGINLNKVQTVVDVKPTEISYPAPAIPEKIPEQTPVPIVEPAAVEKIAAAEPSAENLDAMFERDIVADGTVMRPNHVFEQTWVMRNTGTVAWPAGCCVRFVSGDYMGHVDPNHPAGTQELVSAFESTISHETVAPGEEFHFTVLLRTPSRVGKAISYWRLTSDGGIKFGDRLWCDVDVKATEEAKEEVKEEIKEEPKKAEAAEEQAAETTEDAEKASDEATSNKQLEGSEMIFPKLEKESPVSSVYYTDAHSEPVKVPNASDSFEFDWADEESEEGFLTDDEYDILDASDEEFLDEQQGKVQKK